MIIDQDSSHGYEAMLWSFAAPSAVHRALVFIGMKPGAPRDPNALRFTPKGERVNVSILIDGKPTPIEHLILDTQTGKTLPEEGWVFTGSRLIKDPADPASPRSSTHCLASYRAIPLLRWSRVFICRRAAC